MTARLLDGRALAGHLRTELRDRVERLAETVGHGHPPVLAILTDGHHGAASLYAASLERAAKSVGVETDVIAGLRFRPTRSAAISPIADPIR